MEQVIYGPKGEVARRVVLAGGRPGSSIYRDPDSKKLLVHTTFDAEPALTLAHAVRSEMGAWSGQKNLRRKCVLPEHIYYRLKRDAMKIAHETGQDREEVWKRLLDEYLAENPRFRT